jgi:hypothetical protein
MNGSAVVAIGIDRRSVGRDNGARWLLVCALAEKYGVPGNSRRC